MKIFDRLTNRPLVEALQRSVRIAEANGGLLMERLAELELAIESQGWDRLSADNSRDFSRSALRKITHASRLLFLKNPLINRAVTLQAYYVFGQGMTVSSNDEPIQEAIEAFMSNPRNQAELTSHQARTMKEMDLQVHGNLFLVLFTTDISTGGVTVRSINPDEVEEIITDPDDARSPWFYKRVYQHESYDLAAGTKKTTSSTTYYPDIRHDGGLDAGRPETIGGYPVMWDAPVFHIRVGGLSDMRFGVPETYQAHDWALAYNEFLGNWATITKAYARFAFSVETKGGAKAVGAISARMSAQDSGAMNTNPPVNTASTWISSNSHISPVKTSGATTSAADGMYLALMVSAAMGMPYPMLMGDPSTGNLATAKTLDRPTELKFRDRQELWRHIFTTVLEYAIVRSKRAAGGALRPYGDDYHSPITVSYPPILEHDITEQVRAIISAATLDGKTPAGTIPLEHISRMVLTALGVQNVEEIVAAIEDIPDDVEPQVAEALRGLRSAIDTWSR